MSAPTAKQLARMEWGRKAIGQDLHTGGTQNRPRVSWPVQTGGWVTQDGPKDGEPCGQGLHAALTVAGMSSAHRLTESVCCVVGWLPEDVLGRDGHKVRAKRLYVSPGSVGFPTLLRTGWGTGANLTGANLYRANLSRADLTGADLSGADLYRANLTGANLSEANLSGADLYRAYLYRANLTGANLSEANLSEANLYRANLTGANLTGANLTRANLTGANADRWTRLPDGYRMDGTRIVRGTA